MKRAGKEIKVFTHPHRTWDFGLYVNSLEKHKVLNHQLGFDGTLLFTSHHDYYDPWVTAQWLCEGTSQIPLIAVNPIYLSPFVAARKVLSIMSLYQRDVAINWITGTAQSDLKQMGDELNKAERYARLAEYIKVFNLYLTGKVFSFEGHYYSIKNAVLRKPENAPYQVISYLAGSSNFINNLLDDTAPIHLQMLPNPRVLKHDLSNKGFAFGIILGETEAEAKERAGQIFAHNRLGEKTLALALGNTDSTWKRQLAENVNDDIDENGYWLKPLKNYSEVPFMVLSIERCRELLNQLISRELTNLVISLADEKDYGLLRKCFD